MKKNQASECGTLFHKISDALRHEADTASSPKVAREHLKALKAVLSHGEEGMKGLKDFATKNKFARGFQIAEEARIGAMLFAPRTQSISVISGNVLSSWNVLETSLGARMGRMFGKISPEASEELIRGARLELGQMASEHMKLREWVQAFRDEDLVNHPWNSASQLEGAAITSPSAQQYLLNISNGNDGVLNSALNALGGYARLSGKLLERGDARTKLIAGRARHMSVMYAHYVKKGHSDADALGFAADQVDRLMARKNDVQTQLEEALTLRQADRDVPPELTQMLEDLRVDSPEDIKAVLSAMDQGVEAGYRATMTGQIEGKNWIEKSGQKMGEWAQSVPAVRLMLPFIKTPTNIASETYERTVGAALGVAEVSYRKIAASLGRDPGKMGDILTNYAKRLDSADPRVVAKAVGELSTGIVAASTVYSFASQNHPDNGLPMITGSGPSGSKLKALWRESGWQERSIQIGGKYVSYDRLDPLAGALFGFAADMSEAVRYANSEDDLGAVDDIAFGFGAAIANNITSKTWAKGVREAAELAGDPSERTMRRFAKNIAGSYIPGFARDIERAFGGDIKDIQTVADAVKARIPGLSDSVDPRRNFMGEKVKYTDNPGEQAWNALMPFSVSSIKDSKLARAFSELPQGISLPDTKLSGVDMKDRRYAVNGRSAYDLMLEKSSTVKIGGRTLRQALRRLVDSKDYNRLDALDYEGEDNPRVGMVRKTVDQYRKKAKAEVLRENKTLATDVNLKRQARRDRRQGLNFNFFQQ
jgi:hypothetical protein